MDQLKQTLIKVKETLIQRKFEVILIVFTLFLFWNARETFKLLFIPETTYEKLKPVDRSIERDRFTCYQNRIPQEVIDFCDSQIPEGIRVGGRK
ncbi:hypothetical protein [Leptospira phage LE3]|uniref:Uncharacterized protein n=2 Tax=Nylescharonvirus TaxID=2843431 RepID=A0A343LEF1_9CAUD|nr:hypothetical protein HWB33_gp50 [Leptospira phage LE3]YP_009835523.1 hypothetical protein HWB34_gp48 [Leptospira phage LE4]ATN94944.1 hypothetical protein [Leptospira phage LE3]ATN95061.1 hypothetical protein [Leptospira phage LE4]